MARDDDLLTAIDLLYRSITEPEAIRDFLSRLAGLLDGQFAHVFALDRRGAEVVWQDAHNIDDQTMRIYGERYMHADPRTDHALRNLNRVLSCRLEGLGPRLQRSTVYRDFLVPRDMEYTLWAPMVVGDELHTITAILRSRRGRAFDRDDCALLERVNRHVLRAAEVRMHLRRADAAALTSRALDGLAAGALVVDPHGRVLFTNKAAEEMLARRDGLEETRRLLHASSPGRTVALQEAVAAAADGRGRASTLLLERPSGGTPYSVAICALPPTLEGVAARRAALVVVTEPPAGPAPLEHFRRDYGLTAKEAELLAGLVQGLTLDEIAMAGGVSKNTIRTHLRSTMAKTGTVRQAELVRLALTGAPLLVRG